MNYLFLNEVLTRIIKLIKEAIIFMSKYNSLWVFIAKNGCQTCKMTFEEIKSVLGFPLDHSFLNYKKELLDFGYFVSRISLKEKTVIFEKTAL